MSETKTTEYAKGWDDHVLAIRPLMDAVFPNGTEDDEPTVEDAIHEIKQTQEDLREALKQLRENDQFAQKPLVDALEDIASTLGTSISKRAKAQAALSQLNQTKSRIFV